MSWEALARQVAAQKAAAMPTNTRTPQGKLKPLATPAQLDYQAALAGRDLNNVSSYQALDKYTTTSLDDFLAGAYSSVQNGDDQRWEGAYSSTYNDLLKPAGLKGSLIYDDYGKGTVHFSDDEYAKAQKLFGDRIYSKSFSDSSRSKGTDEIRAYFGADGKFIGNHTYHNKPKNWIQKNMPMITGAVLGGILGPAAGAAIGGGTTGAVASGATAGAVNAGVTGGNVLKGALLGGVTGGAAGAAGRVVSGATGSGLAGKIAAGAVKGGVGAGVGGGNILQGALVGGASSGAGSAASAAAGGGTLGKIAGAFAGTGAGALASGAKWQDALQAALMKGATTGAGSYAKDLFNSFSGDGAGNNDLIEGYFDKGGAGFDDGKAGSGMDWLGGLMGTMGDQEGDYDMPTNDQSAGWWDNLWDGDGLGGTHGDQAGDYDMPTNGQTPGWTDPGIDWGKLLGGAASSTGGWLKDLMGGKQENMNQAKMGIGILGMLASLNDKGGGGGKTPAQLRSMVAGKNETWDAAQQAASKKFFTSPLHQYKKPNKTQFGVDPFAPKYAGGGRVEPRIGSRSPLPQGGSGGGLSSAAIAKALKAEKAKPHGVGALKANPVTNPAAITAARMRRAEAGYAGGGMVNPLSQIATDIGSMNSNTFVSPAMAEGGALSRYVRGQGGGQDDLVEARLSPGEYVFDADAVAALGDGSNEAGARKLDEMRRALRQHKRSASRNSIPPKAKAPEDYLKKGR